MLRQFQQFGNIAVIVEDIEKTIPTFLADTDFAGIVEALPEMPGLSKIS